MSEEFFSHAGFIQLAISQGDSERNFQQLRRLLDQLAPPRNTLIVLPELWAYGFDYRRAAQQAAKTPDLLAQLSELAAAGGLYFAGSLLEQAAPPYNTLFVSGPGGLLGSYRKQHLFAPWKENLHFQPGNAPVPVQTPHGLLGGLVCYDLRFPELARAHCFGGCRLLAVSAQWPAVRRDHWRVLLQARAIENQVFVVASNCCGVSGERDFAGHSLVVAPDGRILAEAGETESAQLVSLDVGELEEVRSRFCSVGERPHGGADRNKVMTLEGLRARLAHIRPQGARIAFTNGCFDLLHAGHVDYLEQARGSADYLVVGLNSDSSVRALKGDTRPVNREDDRARVLAGLGCVDAVVIFADETPLSLITAIQPDVLVKGADWPEEQIVGAREVKASGGMVLRIPFARHISTSAVIAKIQKNNGNSEGETI